MIDPFDEAARQERNGAARTKTEEVTDIARLILGPDAETRDIERTALALNTLPKDIIVHARKAVQKRLRPDSTTPEASEVAEALLAHPGLVHDVVGLLWKMDQSQLGAGPWHEGPPPSGSGVRRHPATPQWYRDLVWPMLSNQMAAARVRQTPNGTWLWSISPTLTPGRPDKQGSTDACEDAKREADEALEADGWLLL